MTLSPRSVSVSPERMTFQAARDDSAAQSLGEGGCALGCVSWLCVLAASTNFLATTAPQQSTKTPLQPAPDRPSLTRVRLSMERMGEGIAEWRSLRFCW